MKDRTSGTAIAALEAARNTEIVLSEGSIVGERRAAWARLAQVAMFGIIVNVTGGSSRTMFVIGFVYTVYTLMLLYGVHRIARPSSGRARWIPVVIATVDFGFVTVQGVLGNEFQGFGNLGVVAIGTVIPLSFAVARSPVYHVFYAVALAEIGFNIVAADMGAWHDQVAAVVFISGGLLVLGLMIAMTNVAVRNMFSGLRKRDNLTRFLPQQIVDRVLAIGPEALAPVEREVTVMFSDIRGFTAMSEGLEPREVLMMLDDYFGRMSQIVKGHDGVVGKFIGDGMLAFWGVPDRLADHAVRAVRAARDMRRAVRELNEYRSKSGLPALRVGIGIHTGPVAAGMLGGSLQAEYTVIGDAVNVASRIEGLTKDHHVDVLVSETTWTQLPPSRRGDKLATAEIRGRREPVVLYTLDPSAASVEVQASSGPQVHEDRG